MFEAHSPSTKPDTLRKEYDVCVITAANEYQAQGYREQLRWRRNINSLPEGTEFLVFSDPQGKRIGSGGSTLYVLCKLLEHFYGSCEDDKYQSLHELFRGKRILILHSGGDSRRLPAYSAVGKIFFPLPTSSRHSDMEVAEGVTLFDIFLSNLTQLPYLSDGQMIIASGDVLLSLGPSQIVFSDIGVTGLAYPGPIEVASNHGVYVVPQGQLGDNLREVADFLQKPTSDELKNCNGLDAADRAFIDTGVMNFSLDAIEILVEALGISLENGKIVSEKDSLHEELVNANVQLDIYKEIPFAMLGKDGQGRKTEERKGDPLTPLQRITFHVNLLPHCEFFHIGTSRQLLQEFHTINYTASAYDFQNFSRSKVVDEAGLESAFVYNSLINTHSMKADGPCFIEGCCLEGQIQLKGGNILTGIPENAGDIKLQEGVCVSCVPVNEAGHGWVSIIYGISDSFKRPAGDNDASFLNSDLLDWMDNRGILSDDLWEDDEEHELWNARLFPFAVNPAESMQIALSLQAEDLLLDKWRQARRMSLQEILRSVDYERFLSNYSDLCRKVNLESLASILRLQSDLPASEILSWLTQSDDYNTAAKAALELIEGSEDILFHARLYKLLGSILGKAHEYVQGKRENIDAKTIARIKALPYLRKLASGNRDIEHSGQDSGLASWALSLEDAAFELIREAIGEGLKNAIDPLAYESIGLKIQIRSDEVVWVCAPARLDFAGGWSDTPPYCLEHGGSVLNAAVKLNGQYPIQVIGKLHPEPFIKINSIDLGERVTISEISEMLSYQDPTDWSALAKAAFVATGLIPENTESDLEGILRELGSGIDLTLFSAIPAGSGLGTSSILGAAIIACLSKILGQDLTQEDLFNRTLYVEQLMTTGGGWQDQIGGLVSGVKHIQTAPGLFQIPRISWTDLQVESSADISDRLLLYYTGYRRMAKNILRNIVGKYLDRDPIILKTITQLREKSFEIKSELDHRNIDEFGRKIAEVWKLNKTLDPGSSNENIEAILNRILHLIYGAKLLGAGGGGFLFMVTKGEEETRKIRQMLTEEPPNDRARFFDFDIDPHGLRVNVL
ncbi:L-fucokinase [Candidatus Poribacteria bacterium]